MPRIPYPELSELHPSLRQFVQDNPQNVTRQLAGASEAVFYGFLEFSSAFINGSSLPATLREIAILRVGYLSGSTYEVFQHKALAHHVGLGERAINAIAAGQGTEEALGDAGQAVLAFVDDVVINIRAGDETLAAVRRHLDDTQVRDLTLVIGAYMMVCRFLETTGVEIEDGAIDWSQFTPAATFRGDT